MDSERLIAACVLSVVGGFLDIYTYLFRGNVFANAVTGNMVLFGFHFANGKWEMCGRYLLAIVSYAFGIFMANLIHARLPGSRRITWNQFVILVELVCLLPVCFIPYGRWDFLVNSGIAFVCALQVQTFRRVHGLPFAESCARRCTTTASSSASFPGRRRGRCCCRISDRSCSCWLRPGCVWFSS